MLQNRNLYHEDQHGAKLKFAYRRGDSNFALYKQLRQIYETQHQFGVTVNHHPFGPLQKIRIKIFSPKRHFHPQKALEKRCIPQIPLPLKNTLKSLISIKMSSIFTANSQKKMSRKAHFLFHEFVFWWPMDNLFSELAQSKPKPPADWSEL